MSVSGESGLAMVAWLVALALALAGGGVVVSCSFYRQALRAERKLQALESAVAEFCDALRARLVAERARLAFIGSAGARETRASAEDTEAAPCGREAAA